MEGIYILKPKITINKKTNMSSWIPLYTTTHICFLVFSYFTKFIYQILKDYPQKKIHFSESRSPKPWQVWRTLATRVLQTRHGLGERDSPKWHVTGYLCMSPNAWVPMIWPGSHVWECIIFVWISFGPFQYQRLLMFEINSFTHFLCKTTCGWENRLDE